MSNGVFENINYQKQASAKVFLTRMDSSGVHWHHEYELLVVLKDSLQVFCGPEPILLTAGDVMLFNSKTVHGFRGRGNNNICLFIQFTPRVFEAVLKPNRHYHFYLNSTSEFCKPRVPFAHFVQLAARIGLASLGSDPAAQLRTSALVATLAADLVEHTQYDIRTAPLLYEDGAGQSVAERICAYVEENLACGSLAADLCRVFGMSEKTLYRYLKTELGITQKELISAARIERARSLLHNTDKPIGVIVAECGFSGEMSFYRLFKKELGITPNEYRQGGEVKQASREIQGYLLFDHQEGVSLLRSLAQGKPLD